MRPPFSCRAYCRDRRGTAIHQERLQVVKERIEISGWGSTCPAGEAQLLAVQGELTCYWIQGDRVTRVFELRVRDGNVRSRLSLRRAAGALLLAGRMYGPAGLKSRDGGRATAAPQATAARVGFPRKGGGRGSVSGLQSRGRYALDRFERYRGYLLARCLGRRERDHRPLEWIQVEAVAGASVPSGGSWHLEAITAIPATNPVQLLAVGATSSHALIELWDGTRWE